MTLTPPTGAPLWTVSAEFTDRDDAVAFMDLARELGVLTQLSSRSINERTPARNPVRTTRLGKLVLGAFQSGRSHDLEEFMGVCEEGGYKPASASPVLSMLVEQGDVERLASGVYRLARRAVCLGGGAASTVPCIGRDCETNGCLRLRPNEE